MEIASKNPKNKHFKLQFDDLLDRT